ncbi:MAG: DUF433 domain-containing protein [Anaerolineae bacterium]|nr:DUF433 domain-containing protein [Anaerolineae bacterium]
MIATPVPIDVPLRRDQDNTLRVGRSRVTLHTVIADFHRGASPEEIVHHYPALDLADVYVVIGFYLQNRAVVDEYIRELRKLNEQARTQFEELSPSDSLREKLLNRLAQQDKENKV